MNNKKKEIEEICIHTGSTIRNAMQAIARGIYGTTFVIDKKGLYVNLLTDGDLRSALLQGHGLESTIEVIKKDKSVVAYEDMSPQQIDKLFNQNVRIIPILNNENKIISFHHRDKRTSISVTETFFNEKELEYVNECILSGWVSSNGPFVKKFELSVSKFTKMKYAIATSSGTSALHLALLSCGIGKEDEVIVPSLTFIATANAVSYTGAKPVFVDSEPISWNIDTNKIEKYINEKTKAIIPVHLFGQPAEMDKIMSIAKKYNLYVIEDAAESHGAKYKDKITGSFGDVSTFSFFGNKIITTGEGGMVVTNNKEIAEKCIILRDHGMSKDKRYWHTILGYNYRMTNLQAALGLAQMEKIEEIILRKKEIAKKYTKNLKNVPGISFPSIINERENVYWLFTIVIDEIKFGSSVEKIIQYCKKLNIDTRPVFIPMHKQPIYDQGLTLEVSEMLSKNGISLPSAPQISDDMIKKVCDAIIEINKKH